MNYNYEPSARTTYSRTTSTTDAKDTKFEATTSLEAIEALGFEMKTKTLDNIKEVVAKAANFVPGGEAVGKFVTSDLVKDLTDKVKAVETKITNESKTIGYTNTIEAGKVDSQLFYTTRTHIWRYPVKKPAPSWLVGSLINGNSSAASGDLYITVVAPDSPVTGSTKSMNASKWSTNSGNSLYQPAHEEGNLFSYPTTLSAIPGYSARQFSLIPSVMPITYSPKQERHKANVQTTSGKSSSKSRETTSYGQISSVIGTLKLLSGKSSDLRPNTRSEVFSKKFDSKEEVEVTYPDPSKPFDWRDVTFSSQFDLFVDEGGIMKVGFAVTDLLSTAGIVGQ